MSESAKLQSLKGVVERVNPRGLKVAGSWYDFDRSFPEGDRPGAEIVGQEVELALAEAKSGKQFIRAFETSGEITGDPEGGDPPPAEAPAPENSTLGGDSASPKQVEFVKLLTEKAGLSDDDLERLTDIRFGKAFADLTKREASMTIAFLGGGDNSGRGRSRTKQQ